MNRTLSNMTCLALAMILGLSTATAQEAAPVDFLKDIPPIFRDRCLSCHAGSANGGLLLTSADTWRHGGDSGSVFSVGDADNSLIWQPITRMEREADAPSDCHVRNLSAVILDAARAAGCRSSQSSCGAPDAAAIFFRPGSRCRFVSQCSGLLQRRIGGPGVFPPQPDVVSKEGFSKVLMRMNWLRGLGVCSIVLNLHEFLTRE